MNITMDRNKEIYDSSKIDDVWLRFINTSQEVGLKLPSLSSFKFSYNSKLIDLNHYEKKFLNVLLDIVHNYSSILLLVP